MRTLKEEGILSMGIVKDTMLGLPPVMVPVGVPSNSNTAGNARAEDEKLWSLYLKWQSVEARE